jgi:hypothetical protein
MTEARVTPIRPFDPGNYSDFSRMQVGEALIYLGNARGGLVSQQEYATLSEHHPNVAARVGAGLGVRPEVMLGDESLLEWTVVRSVRAGRRSALARDLGHWWASKALNIMVALEEPSAGGVAITQMTTGIDLQRALADERNDHD